MALSKHRVDELIDVLKGVGFKVLQPAKVTGTRNLRCAKPGCDYMTKTPVDMMKRARPKCPICQSKLLTPAERRETRGRKFTLVH